MAKRDPRGLVPDRSETVLLVLDMISDFEFADGEEIARAALPVAKRIAALRTRAKRAGVPVIYANDAIGRWRSDFPGLVRHCARAASHGAAVVAAIAPEPDDYCVLKPKHSAFFASPLATLLEHLRARRLVLTGASSHQCVLFTANDAYLRDLELFIPRDCISARTARETRFALRYFADVLGADLRPSRVLRFPSRRRAAGAASARR